VVGAVAAEHAEKRDAAELAAPVGVGHGDDATINDPL
jgi:hypothetical protein